MAKDKPDASIKLTGAQTYARMQLELGRIVQMIRETPEGKQTVLYKVTKVGRRIATLEAVEGNDRFEIKI